MSKMRMPEMKAVRFEESDVIVASFSLHRVADGTKGNAYVSYNGVHYGNTQSGGRSYDRLFDVFNSENDGTFGWDTPMHYSVGEESFRALIEMDNGDASSPSIDGSYTWDGSSFTHQ